MHVWIHQWKGNEWGWSAWSLDHLGFATWAPSRRELLDRTPEKLTEYRQWLARHGSNAPAFGAGKIVVVEEISGNEVAFEHDLAPAGLEEISRCLELLKFSREDLVSTVENLTDSLLDWDPPYRHFAPWAWWRTIRQILAHLALTETGYYLPAIGCSGPDPSHYSGAHWREQLLQSRRETEWFLAELAASGDRARVTQNGETWSVRKVLRRLVWHELLHWKSIKRIVRAYHE